MHNHYVNQPLAQVPYDDIFVGMPVKGARGVPGKVVHKSIPSFSEEGWIRIDWTNHPQQANHHSYFKDVIVQEVALEPVVEKRRLVVKAKLFTFTPIARGAVMHLMLYQPSPATRAALPRIDPKTIITQLSLWQREESTDGDEVHEGPYEIMSVFRDPKNGDEVWHVVFKHLDLCEEVARDVP
jgi:hypothetical protein